MGAVALGRISILAGVKVQEDWSGSAEQESVMNIGAVSDEAFSGVMETTTFPALPGVMVSVAGATETVKSGVEVAWA